MLKASRGAVVLEDFQKRWNMALNDMSATRFQYEEQQENGRVVLLSKKAKLIEIKDTKKDRELYSKVMKDYTNYVVEKLGGDNFTAKHDFNKSFDEEILVEEKLPMFFVYNTSSNICGTAGFRSVLHLNINGKDVAFQEASLRMATQKMSNVAGMTIAPIIWPMVCLYAIRHKVRVFEKTYPYIRELMFKFCKEYCHHEYICTLKYKYCFSNSSVDYDVFFDTKIDKKTLEQFKKTQNS